MDVSWIYSVLSCNISLSLCTLLEMRKTDLPTVYWKRIRYPWRCQLTATSLPCGEGNGSPLQCSCLENPMDGGAWWGAVHGAVKSRTRLSDFPFTFHFHALEKEMATHSSVLAWRIPGTGEPGGLPSMRSHKVGHDWSDLAAAAEEFTMGCLKYGICLY